MPKIWLTVALLCLTSLVYLRFSAERAEQTSSLPVIEQVAKRA